MKLALCLIATALFSACATATGPKSPDGTKPEAEARMEGHVLRPAQLEPTEERIHSLRLPDGFSITVFARDLGKPRMMAMAQDGTLYVTRREPGDVLMLRDTNNDGQADQVKTAVELKDAHGIAIEGDTVFIATIKEVYRFRRQKDGTLGARKKISDLPDGGQHPNRTLGISPQGHLFVTVGSTCNACEEPNEEHATIIRMNKDGSNRRIFARGLRNTLGFGWNPATQEMWGMDHGSDWMGNDIPPEELNRIVEGGHYGWPWWMGHGEWSPHRIFPEDEKGMSKEEFLKQVSQPVLTYTAHASPMMMVFYQGFNFPPEYRGDAFLALRGSWNRNPAVGYKVVRIRFGNGQPYRFEDFLTGFLLADGRSHFGRPVGLAVTRDGALLVGDDTNGMIYRVFHTKEPRTRDRRVQPPR